MDMEQKIKDVISFSMEGKTTKLKSAVFELLNQKANERLDLEKMTVAGNMFKTEDSVNA